MVQVTLYIGTPKNKLKGIQQITLWVQIYLNILLQGKTPHDTMHIGYKYIKTCLKQLLKKKKKIGF